jgi:hypothetical protein
MNGTKAGSSAAEAWAAILALRRDSSPQGISEIERSKLVDLLGEIWGELPGGSETGMSSDKLHRIENVSWEGTKLMFDIERHGAQSFGSTRATVYRWTLDLETREASHSRARSRQVIPRAASLDIRPIVAKVVNAIQAGNHSDHPLEAIKWISADEIRITASGLLPSVGVPKMTVEGRRKRFRELLGLDLKKIGWLPMPGNAIKFRRETRI